MAAKGKTLCPEKLSREQKLKIVEWVNAHYMGIRKTDLTEWWEDMYDWSHGGGHYKRDWYLTFRRWIRTNAKNQLRFDRPRDPIGESEAEALAMANENVIQLDLWKRRA